MNSDKDEKYLNPFSDFGFKKLFGEEANKDLLINFLNSLLLSDHKIINLTFKNNEQLGNTQIDRKAIFDLYCEDEKGQKFIVELQKAEQKFFKDRALYYSTFPIQEQAVKGEWDYKLQPVYCVGILDFVFDEDKKNGNQYFYKVGLSDLETNKLFYDKLYFIYLAVPKFNKSEHELSNDTEKWIYFLKNLTKFKDIPNELNSETFMKAFQIAKLANFTEKERQDYQNSLKYYNDLKNSMDKSFEDGMGVGFEKGEAIGIQKGEAIGIQKGEAIGIQKGEAIGIQKGEVIGIQKGEVIGIQKEKTEIILNGHKEGLPNEILSKITGLSINEVEEIIKFNKKEY